MFRDNIFCFRKKIIFLLLFRVIHFSNFKCIFQHLNQGHKEHSMVQNKDRTFIFHNPKQFLFFCDPYPRRHTIAVFRFCDSSHLADGWYGDLELCSLKLRRQQELVRSLIGGKELVIPDSHCSNQDVKIIGSFTNLSGYAQQFSRAKHWVFLGKVTWHS